MKDSSSTTANKPTIGQWLHQATTLLQSAGIETARLDALVLLADELERDKAWILAYSDHILQIKQSKNLNKKIAQRCAHTPLAYLLGYSEFYGRKFEVNKDVLVPRPESESMIDLLLGLFPHNKKEVIVDIGTGSGCLAVTAKLELPSSRVLANDIDARALKIARRNARRLSADVEFSPSDLLISLKGQLNGEKNLVILANLPYVPIYYPINEAACHEPPIALFSGKDGLDHYKKLFAQIADFDMKPQYVITESLMEQHDELMRIAYAAGFTLAASNGLAQAFKTSRSN